jgi:hypothetical protein
MALADSYVVAQRSRLVLKAGKTDEMVVKGLQGLTIPIGATGETVTVQALGERIGKKVGTGLAYEDISTTAYWAAKNASQVYLMDASRNARQIQDARFYLDDEDFAALDLINDPGGYLGVTTFGSPTANKNEVYTSSVTFSPSGSFVMFEKHVVGTTLSFTAGGVGVSAQVTDSGSGFVAAGFEPGDVVLIDHLNSLDPLYAKVKTVAAGTITFEDAIGNEATIPTHSGVSTTAIHGATPIEIITGF